MKRGNAAVAPPPEKSTTLGAARRVEQRGTGLDHPQRPHEVLVEGRGQGVEVNRARGTDGLEPPRRQHEAVERPPERLARRGGELRAAVAISQVERERRGAAVRERLRRPGSRPVASTRSPRASSALDDRGPEAARATHHDDAPRFVMGRTLPRSRRANRRTFGGGRAGDPGFGDTPGIACPPVSFAAQYLREVSEISAGLDAPAIDAIAEALAEVRERGGRLFILGAGGRRGPRLARGQRLPQDLRPGELRAQRQRLRAHRAGERRGLGDRLLRLAARLAAARRRRDPRVLGGRRLPRARALHEPGQRDRAGARGGRPRGAASSARTTAPPRRSPTHCVVVRGAPAERLTPHTEAFQAVVWHLLVSHPALAMRAGTWEVIDHAEETPAS